MRFFSFFLFFSRFFTFGQVKSNALDGRSRHQTKFWSLRSVFCDPEGRHRLLGTREAGHRVHDQEDGKVDVQTISMAWERARRCGRCVLGKPSLVQRFVTRPPVDTLTLNVDSDHAECWRTRRSTREITGYHGIHVTKAASTTKTVIVLSSAGALRDQAWFCRCVRHEEPLSEVKEHWRQTRCQNVALSLRLGAWKVRIVGTQLLWVQGLATGGVQRFGKIPGTSSEADPLTKLLHGKKIQELVQTVGYHHTRGRSQ